LALKAQPALPAHRGFKACKVSKANREFKVCRASKANGAFRACPAHKVHRDLPVHLVRVAQELKDPSV
jgi:hypothetical protein